MFTTTMKKVALGLSLAAVLFATGTAYASGRYAPKNPSPGSFAVGQMSSTALLDAIDRGN